MSAPVKDAATSASQITVTWSPIATGNANTGGTAIVYYSLEWNQGTGTWQELTTPNNLVTTFT